MELLEDISTYTQRRRREIGQRIKQVRTQKGFLQEQAAELLGCTRVTFTRVELGLSELTVSELEYLALVWKVPVRTLLVQPA